MKTTKLLCCFTLLLLLILAVSACDIQKKDQNDSEFHTSESAESSASAETEPPTPQGEIEMRPTSAEWIGRWDEMLVLPVGDLKYRYARTEYDTSKYEKGDELYLFSEEYYKLGHMVTSTVTVYSIKDHDLSRIYVISTDPYDTYEQIYQYAPPMAAAPDELEKAKRDGYIVSEDGTSTCGQEIWYEFYNTTLKGTPAEIKLANYYTLNKERTGKELYETTKEDYPRIHYTAVTYDGAQYTVSFEEGITRNYTYLLKLTDVLGEHSAYPGRIYERYVLTNVEDVTWNDIMFGLLSSQLGDYIDHYSVYTEIVKE